MTRETFIQTCDLAEQREEGIFLGGGEPTVHPLFWDFVGIALGRSANRLLDCPLGLITNGKRTEDALRLYHLAKASVVFAELSLDSYHEIIDQKVVKTFSRPISPDQTWLNRVRSVNHIIGAGRAKSWGDKKSCCCSEMLVEPTGKIYACGCRNLSFGTINKPNIPDNWPSGVCHKDKEARDALAEWRKISFPAKVMV